MYNILKTIEFLGHHISKNETVSMKLFMKLVSFYHKMTKTKMILVIAVTARKLSESECLK